MFGNVVGSISCDEMGLNSRRKNIWKDYILYVIAKICASHGINIAKI